MLLNVWNENDFITDLTDETDWKRN